MFWLLFNFSRGRFFRSRRPSSGRHGSTDAACAVRPGRRCRCCLRPAQSSKSHVLRAGAAGCVGALLGRAFATGTTRTPVDTAGTGSGVGAPLDSSSARSWSIPGDVRSKIRARERKALHRDVRRELISGPIGSKVRSRDSTTPSIKLIFESIKSILKSMKLIDTQIDELDPRTDQIEPPMTGRILGHADRTSTQSN